MSVPYKPFNVATKHLIESDPLAWLQFVGLPGTTAALFDPELSSFVADADMMLRITDPDYLAHIEMQSAYKTDLGERTLFHNVVAFRKHRLSVASVIVLLRKEADGPAMTGRVQYGKLFFEYEILRVWEKSPADLLAAPLALLPLAPLTNIAQDDVPELFRKMEVRRFAEVGDEDKETFWGATMLLMGLKYPREWSMQLLQGVMDMTESSTYQYILEKGMAEGEAKGEARGEAKGKAEEARNILLKIGAKRFGNLNAKIQATLEAITSHEQLEQLIERALEVESWRELFL